MSLLHKEVWEINMLFYKEFILAILFSIYLANALWSLEYMPSTVPSAGNKKINKTQSLVLINLKA